MSGYREQALALIESVWPAARFGAPSEAAIDVQIANLIRHDEPFVEPDVDPDGEPGYRPHRDERWA